MTSVADQEPGIEEEEIEHIFENFYRGKNVRYRVPGTGMGLPIAKMIVEAHGGTIRVINCAGGFRFHLQLANNTRRAYETPPAEHAPRIEADSGKGIQDDGGDP